MIAALLHFIAGTLGGLCSSVPIGPTNLWVADMVLARRDRELRWFLGGVIATDLVFAGVACWFRHAWLGNPGLSRIVSLGGGLFLVGLGIVMLRCRGERVRESGAADSPAGRLRQAFLGAFMIASNPAFFLFRVFAADVLVRIRGESAPSLVPVSLFLAGIALGDAIWFATLARLLRRGMGKVRTGRLEWARGAIALGFMGLGVVAIVRTIAITLA